MGPHRTAVLLRWIFNPSDARRPWRRLANYSATRSGAVLRTGVNRISAFCAQAKKSFARRRRFGRRLLFPAETPQHRNPDQKSLRQTEHLPASPSRLWRFSNHSAQRPLAVPLLPASAVRMAGVTASGLWFGSRDCGCRRSMATGRMAMITGAMARAKL